jgi:hypothetical protein
MIDKAMKNAQWYKNAVQNPLIRVDARGIGAEYRMTPVP